MLQKWVCFKTSLFQCGTIVSQFGVEELVKMLELFLNFDEDYPEYLVWVNTDMFFFVSIERNCDINPVQWD